MRIKELRKKKKLTQGQLADLMQCSQRAISSWENGDRIPDADILIKLADVLDCTIDALVGRVRNNDEQTYNEEIMSMLFDQLSFTQQQEVIAYAEFVKNKNTRT